MRQHLQQRSICKILDPSDRGIKWFDSLLLKNIQWPIFTAYAGIYSSNNCFRRVQDNVVAANVICHL